MSYWKPLAKVSKVDFTCAQLRALKIPRNGIPIGNPIFSYLYYYDIILFWLTYIMYIYLLMIAARYESSCKVKSYNCIKMFSFEADTLNIYMIYILSIPLTLCFVLLGLISTTEFYQFLFVAELLWIYRI